MNQKEIVIAFDGLSDRISKTFNLPVAWPNSSFAPDGNTPFILPTVIPAPTVAVGLQGMARAWSGIYQILLVVPQNQGQQLWVEMAENIARMIEGAAMPNGSTGVSGLTTQTGEVYLTDAVSIGSDYDGEYGYTVPISAAYRAEAV